MNRHPSSTPPAFGDLPFPTSPEQAEESLRKLAESSRRSFLGRGLAATAVPAAILAGSSMSRANDSQHGKNNDGPFPSYYPGSTRRNFQEIQSDEYSHVNILISAIHLLGGTPRPYPTFRGIDTRDPKTFLALSVAFENTGVGAYFGAAPHIFNKSVLGVAASIAFVEAYHSGFLNTLANKPLLPGGPGLTYIQPLTQEQVVTAVSPYIVSFNDPNNQFPASYSTTDSSTANDVAILNFALIAEYLEATFYFNSVPKVFA